MAIITARRLTLLAAGLFLSTTAARAGWDDSLRVLPRADSIREYMRRLSAHPHHIGTAADKANAEWIRDRLSSWGFEARIESFDVLFPTPMERVLELTSPRPFTATLHESAVAGDSTSAQQQEQLPTYNAYSIDGNVTAPLVYVNYGVPDDYEMLDRLGISVKGCIVIARYGGSWRGIKPKVAAEHGAVGCVIYSDPAGDGYTQGDVYPNGPYRPADGVQRGSVMDMPVYPGDPETPDIGSVPGAPRLERSQLTTVTKIPVLPISYGDAQPLLQALGGPVAPHGWRGNLPITYHVGPGGQAHLKLVFRWDHVIINDVIGVLRGAEFPDEWVMRGNHYDAWVNGAQDPLSGQSAMLEEARCVGMLAARGWRPKRTMMYFAWDGEEEGLLGSTEWVETHAEELRRKAVAYINSDVSDRGFLSMSGSHILERFVNDVAREIDDPETHLSVWKRAQLNAIADAPNAADRVKLRGSPTLQMDALGSGSDYTAFLDHVGIPSLDLGFGGEGGGGIYHSIYDDFNWFTHFADVDFSYGRALAQLTGTAMIRLADAPLLPFSYAELASHVRTYVDELKTLAKTQRDEIVDRNTEAEEGVFAATSNPRMPLKPPPSYPVPPHINFTPLENALDSLERSTARLSMIRVSSNGGTTFETVNNAMMRTEQLLTHQAGLPDRPWFKHQLYAPGLYTGYGVKTIPAVREALERRDYALVDREMLTVAAVLEAEAGQIDHIAQLLANAMH